MQRILFIYPDRLFNDFMKSFLKIKGYESRTSTDIIEGIREAINYMPDLIILNKVFPSLDAMGFAIKKRTLKAIASTPMFLIGDFLPEELLEYKKVNVQAFLSAPINPTAMVERLNILFNHTDKEDYNRTPMLMDIHIRSTIINIQIEGNFDPVSLELLNYLVRSFCVQKKIRTPKMFIMIPSLYPESITKENLERLFKFMTYHELKIDFRGVKILTQNEKLIKLLAAHPDYSNIEVLDSYADGILSLQINFNKQKSIPVNFLKEGATYVFDLFDEHGRKMIPAMTKLTPETIARIKQSKVSRLTYYSEKDEFAPLEEGDTGGQKRQEDPEQVVLMNLITEEFEPIEAELKSLRVLDQKQSLFFRRMKDQYLLIISPEENNIQLIFNTLDVYFNIDYINTGREAQEIMQKKRYAIVFIDAMVDNPDAISILQNIRKDSTRRRTSVIILTKKIDKVEVLRFRKAGTNNILLSPFTTSKLQQAVFDAVTTDRRT